MFQQLFRILPNFYECYNSFMVTRKESIPFINKRSEPRSETGGLEPSVTANFPDQVDG